MLPFSPLAFFSLFEPFIALVVSVFLVSPLAFFSLFEPFIALLSRRTL